MKKFLSLALSILSISASAQSFDERVKIAKAVEETAEYKNYERPMFDSIGSFMATTMKSCFEAVKDADTQKFTFVANIGYKGEALDVDAMPKTNVSTCFSSGMKKAVFPPPPKLAGKNSFPIYIDMKIKD